MATGTVTFTDMSRKCPETGKPVKIIKIDWTSTAGGAASDVFTAYGFLVKAVTVPSGAAAPTINYDITLVDGDGGADAAAGALIDRSDTATQQVFPTGSSAQIPVFLAGSHTFTVANAGNAKSGACYLYLVETL